MDNVDKPYGHKPVARFQPKETDNVRPEVVPLIGEVFTWRYAVTGSEDEPYPGQQRWHTMDDRFGGYWVPAEDLQPVE